MGEDELKLIIKTKENIFFFHFDFISNKLYLRKDNDEYKLVYDLNRKALFSSIGKIYQMNENSIFEKKQHQNNNLFYKYYDYNNNGIVYTVIIENNKDDSDKIVEILLKNNVSDIRDLLKLIGENIDLSNIRIRIIQRTDDFNNYIFLDKGILKEYSESINQNDILLKVYYRNNEFYIEKTARKRIDDTKKMLKILGVNNGKRKED